MRFYKCLAEKQEVDIAVSPNGLFQMCLLIDLHCIGLYCIGLYWIVLSSITIVL